MISPGVSHKGSGSGQPSSDVKQITYAQIAQKKKEEREAREAAEKAALATAAAVSTNCVDAADDAKKIVKDSAVNKKLHGKDDEGDATGVTRR